MKRILHLIRKIRNFFIKLSYEKRGINVVEILTYAKDLLNREVFAGLCVLLRSACFKYLIPWEYFSAICTKFCNEEAQAFGAKDLSYYREPAATYWWTIFEWKDRERFLDYLIKYYTEHPTFL